MNDLENDLEIVFVPDTRLKKVSRDVEKEEFGEELQSHAENMLAKMRDLGGVGISGVQVGDMRNIVIVNSNVADPPIMMINPKITERSEEMLKAEEGCLSFPGLKVEVERNKNISVNYMTPLGEEKTEDYFDLDAVIIQHEMDHLNGKTLLDYISRLKKDIYNRKIKKVKRKIKMMLEARQSVYY
tara:strand:- start:98 stop:652 length:555 start_codon:yes stop_codon:yes gene_type:complete